MAETLTPVHKEIEMGDWSDLMEAYGGRLPPDIADAQMVPGYYHRDQRKKRMSVTFTMTREQKAKYKALGGAAWVKKMLDEATPPTTGD